jgi:hypothetical protein
VNELAKIHLLEDMLRDAREDIEYLERQVKTQSAVIAHLTRQRVDFDLSADSTPCFLRPQAG